MTTAALPRIVLDVGCGQPSPLKLHPAFRRPGWREIRLDVSPDVAPDLLADMTDMRAVVPDASVDAVWSSHNLEHLEAHRVPVALAEFARVLRPDGFALVTCPDLEAIARFLASNDADAVAYSSPSGPITAIDMLWGHGASLAAGAGAMAHRTGFTRHRLGRLALAAGFGEVHAAVRGFDLWALLMMPKATTAALVPLFADTPQRFLLPDLDAPPPA